LFLRKPIAPQQPSSNKRAAQLIPYFNARNRIIGTQLIVGLGNDKKKGQPPPEIFYFETDQEQAFDGNPLMHKLGYKLYREDHGDGEYKAVLAYASLNLYELEQKYRELE